jgi:hypothetical protein
VDIRKSHPGLFHLIMVTAILMVLLAVNFWTSNPAFNPYGWSKNWIGVAFFVLGAGQLVFLNVVRDLRIVRLGLALSFAWNIVWAGANTQQIFNGNASWQLPLYILGIAAVQYRLIVEAPVNPMTEKRE